MNIEITTNDVELFSELEKARMQPDLKLPPNILIGEVRRKPSGLHGISVPEVVNFTINFAASAGASVLSAWLYDRIKGRVQRVKIDGREVELTSDDLNRAVRRTIAGCKEEQLAGVAAAVTPVKPKPKKGKAGKRRGTTAPVQGDSARSPQKDLFT